MEENLCIGSPIYRKYWKKIIVRNGNNSKAIYLTMFNQIPRNQMISGNLF
ncbi:hypothetical protein KL86DYS1_20276 [uncultured Dysgonomonas sp.]|uniref:Uncharacterized protein n=1 Tax=uncultured Dysgonomonas sp. TaxID=206096 RepID=A0A212JMX2_9BACT|nr:hypothetical protein KL86DYS1_20276 [uncultured Dysgonomonas sp.]